VNGWIHFGMASIGVKPPESAMSGGLTKNRMSWACLASKPGATLVELHPSGTSRENSSLRSSEHS